MRVADVPAPGRLYRSQRLERASRPAPSAPRSSSAGRHPIRGCRRRPPRPSPVSRSPSPRRRHIARRRRKRPSRQYGARAASRYSAPPPRSDAALEGRGASGEPPPCGASRGQHEGSAPRRRGRRRAVEAPAGLAVPLSDVGLLRCVKQRLAAVANRCSCQPQRVLRRRPRPPPTSIRTRAHAVASQPPRRRGRTARRTVRHRRVPRAAEAARRRRRTCP